MKSFDRILLLVISLILFLFVVVNLYLANDNSSFSGRPYRVEIGRMAYEIEQNGLENTDVSECTYVTAIEKYSDSNPKFFDSDNDYLIREIRGELYRFDYRMGTENKGQLLITVNVILILMSILVLGVLLFVRTRILNPFYQFIYLPYELSRGNLTMPLQESKDRFFGKFIWGANLLREKLEDQKQRELLLQKEKKTLLLSLSHDIKTPLSAIKLYAKALSKGLYTDEERKREIAEKINTTADEIENLVSQIVDASKEEFLELEVHISEFYLSELIAKISDYYEEKLSLIKTEFTVKEYSDCLLKGDFDRSVEVLQNIMENAIKYGDGRSIGIFVSEEEDCKLIAVRNSGCTLSENELPHIFESFWRGSNTGTLPGSGLGLYICRQLMVKMGGEIFGEIEEGYMCITAVFEKA